MLLSDMKMRPPEINWGEFYHFDESVEHSTMQKRVAALRGFQKYDVVKLKIEEFTAAIEWLQAMVLETHGCHLPFFSGSLVCLSDTLVHIKQYALDKFETACV